MSLGNKRKDKLKKDREEGGDETSIVCLRQTIHHKVNVKWSHDGKGSVLCGCKTEALLLLLHFPKISTSVLPVPLMTLN